ncbi:MAG: amidohydrolase/deacetylase family metallohydrolase [Anaerolineae bacterium]
MNREMYDLILKGGTVVDPAQKLHKALDVAIAGGKIACLDGGLDPSLARQVIDVTGQIVTPGLVDLHTHVYWGGTPLGMNADLVGPATGVTTFVDVGSAGAGNFQGFKEHVIDRSHVRIAAFLHISHLGLLGAIFDPINLAVVGESFDLRYLLVGPAVMLGRAYPDVIRGIKVRTSLEASGDRGVIPLHLALQAAEELGVPVMVHIGPPPPTRREVLSLLRTGDILTHVFRGDPNGPLDRHGRVLPEMRDARQRGVLMDLGHGGSSFSWNMARQMLDQGFLPDIISSDAHHGLEIKTGRDPGLPPRTLPGVMSKMLSLGMSLDEVIRASTITPARAIGLQEEIGSLREGTAADVAVFDLEEGEFQFEDMYSGKTVGRLRLTPRLTLVRGEILSKAPGDFFPDQEME